MAATAEQLSPVQYGMDREHRVRTDTETWLAETLNGSMRTSFEFSFDGQELYGEDGGALGEVFKDAINNAEEIVKANPFLIFELRRRLIEYGEYEDMLAIAKGEASNTMIVVSDYPPELMGVSNDVGGYNGSRKQTMLRVITRSSDGKIRITTQSLDRSNPKAIETVFSALDEPAEEGEKLGQRVKRNLSDEEQDGLANYLTGVYDRSLSEQNGGEWHAGIERKGENFINTYEFACNQRDLVEWFTNYKLNDPSGAENHRYNLVAAVKARYTRYLSGLNLGPIKTASEYNIEPTVSGLVSGVLAGRGILREMQIEGRQASERGEVFSGCGLTVTSDSESTEGQLEGSGYGNKTDALTGATENGIMKCVNCPKCRTPHEEVKARNGYYCCKNSKCGFKVKAKAV